MIASLSLLWLTLGPVAAQAPPPEIYKCIDAMGAVTYQQSKCPSSGKGAKVDLQETGRSFDLPEKEAEWRKAAQDHRVVPGMPRRWVRESLGAPLGMHLGALDGATETWDYKRDERTFTIGFRDGNLLWTRDAAPEKPPAPKAAPPVATAPASVDATDSKPRNAVRRQTVALGQDCASLRAELGPPDEDTGAPAGSPLALLPGGDAKELLYEPAPGDEGVRTRIRCVAGKVIGIDRSHVVAPVKTELPERR